MEINDNSIKEFLEADFLCNDHEIANNFSVDTDNNLEEEKIFFDKYEKYEYEIDRMNNNIKPRFIEESII